jgi:hypothetical protein
MSAGAGAVAKRGLSGWFGLALIVVVSAGYAYNNLAPFLGLNYAGALNMFSGMDANSANHLLLPRLAVSHDYDFAQIAQLEPRPAEGLAAQELRLLLAVAGERGWVNLYLVRYQTDRFCRSSADGQLLLVVRRQDGAVLQYDDACAVPAAREYALVTSYPLCRYGCQGRLHSWARGELLPP